MSVVILSQLTRDDEVSVSADRQRPHLAMVARQLKQHLVSVDIPVFEQPVLPHREAVVCVVNKRDLHHRVPVRKQRLVTVAKVEAPDLIVLAGFVGT